MHMRNYKKRPPEVSMAAGSRPQLDALAKEQRELDTLLQQSNWTTPLIE